MGNKSCTFSVWQFCGSPGPSELSAQVKNFDMVHYQVRKDGIHVEDLVFTASYAVWFYLSTPTAIPDQRF